MKKIISFLLNLFVFWIVTVASGIEFIGLTGNYHIDIVVNGLLWDIFSLIQTIITILMPVIAGAIVGIFISRNDEIVPGCACLSFIGGLLLSMIVSILFLMNAYKILDFFPAYNFWQAAIIEVITTTIGLAMGDY